MSESPFDSADHDDWERLATNLRVERALLPILELLSDLPVVVFKGGTLTRLIYGDLRRRASADNDLWLSEPSCSKALQRLLAQGFEPEPGIDPWAGLRRNGQIALWPQGDTRAVSVDLHAEPFMGQLFDVDVSAVRAHLVPLDLHGHQVLTFDRTLSLAHLVAHFLQHRLERPHLRDIGAAWDNWDIDETELRTLARSTCTEAALEHALWLSAQLELCSKPPLALTSRRARLFARLNAPARGTPAPTRGRILSYLLASPQRLPAAALRGVLLDDDDLQSRYGSGTRWKQTLGRVLQLLTRG